MSNSSDWLTFSWSSSDRAILEERARRLSDPSGQDLRELVPSPTHAFFAWGGQPLAVELSVLTAVLPARGANRLPDQATGLIGYEREIYWVDSLAVLAGLSSATGSASHVMLLRSCRVGFWVERLEGLEMLEDEGSQAGKPCQGSLLAVRRHLPDGRLLVGPA